MTGLPAQPAPPPVAAVRAAWDTVTLLGGRRPSQELPATLDRVMGEIEGRGFGGQDMRRGMVALLGALAETVFAPGHPAMRQAEGEAAAVISSVMMRFLRHPKNRPYEGEVNRLLELTAMGGDGLAWRDAQEGDIHPYEALALGRAVWLVADLHDAMTSQPYLSDRLVNEVAAVMQACEDKTAAGPPGA